MEQLRVRPFALFCLCFVLGVAFAELSLLCGTDFLPYAAVCGGCALVCFVFALGPRFRRRFLFLACCALCAAAGLLCHYFSVARKEAALLCHGETPVSVECTVTERLGVTVYGASYRCRVTEVAGKPLRAEILVQSENAAFFPVGQRLRFTAVLSSPEEQTAGGFPERRYRRSLGLLAETVLGPNAAVETLGEERSLSLLLARFRRTVAARTDQGAAYGDGGLCAALMVGDRSGIDARTALDLRRAGITHLLAISGMHLSLLVGGVHFLLRRLRVRRGMRFLLLSLLCAFYCAAAGFSYSVLRAALMLGFVFLAYLFGRERDVFTALSGAVACILAVSPTAASGCSLWLSAFSTFGILLAASLSHRISFWLSERRPFVQLLFEGLLLPLGVSVSATLASLPVTWLIFRQVSLAAPVATLLCSPLTAILLFFSCVLAVFGFPLPLLTPAAGLCARLLLKIARFFSDRRGVLLSLSYSFVPVLLTAGLLLLAAVFLLRKRARTVALCLLLAVLLAFPAGVFLSRLEERDRLDAVFTSYGRCDLVAVGCDDNSGILLFDLSNGYSRAVQAAENAAAELCKTEVELLVITRLDNAAVRMIRSLGESVRLRQVLLPTPANEKEEAVLLRAETAAGLAGASCGVFAFGDAFRVGTVACTVFPSETVSHSVVPVRSFTVEKEDVSFFFVSSGSASAASYRVFQTEAAAADLLFLGASGPKNLLEPHYSTVRRVLAEDAGTGVRISLPVR